MILQKIAKKRKMTAREAGLRFGKSARTIRRLVALDRSDYEAEAKERREKAYTLKQQGMTWAEVGEAMGCTAEAASQLGKRYRQTLREQAMGEKSCTH